MNPDKHTAVVCLLTNDALEAALDQSSQASLFLIDAAVTILVNSIKDTAGRRRG